MMTAHPRIAAVALAILAWPALIHASVEDEPRLLLTQVTERLIQEASQNGESLRHDPDRAFGLAEEVIAPTVDFVAISRRILGPYWREAEAQDREKFAREYRTFVLRSLISAFMEHLESVPRYGARLTYLPTRLSEDGRSASVRGRLGLDSGVPLEIEFRLQRSAGAWKVFDVSLAGVSLVQANQATFQRELSTGGVRGLTDRLAAHNRELEGGAVPTSP